MASIDFIPGQEEENMHYVLEHQAGAYAQGPAEIVSLIREWLQPDDNTLKEMAANAAGLAQPQATLNIARRLRHILTEKQVSHPISPVPDTHSRSARSEHRPRASRLLWRSAWATRAGINCEPDPERSNCRRSAGTPRRI